MTTTDQEVLNNAIRERLEKLPQVVRDTITSANTEKQLQELAKTHQLHVDQWQALENEVTLTLLGFEPGEKLEDNLVKELGIERGVAGPLVDDISRMVFEPIRESLERELGHPSAKVEEVSDVEKVRQDVLAKKEVVAPAEPVHPGTPPVAPSGEKAARGPSSGAYKPGEASSTRKTTTDDPYREPTS